MNVYCRVCRDSWVLHVMSSGGISTTRVVVHPRQTEARASRLRLCRFEFQIRRDVRADDSCPCLSCDSCEHNRQLGEVYDRLGLCARCVKQLRVAGEKQRRGLRGATRAFEGGDASRQSEISRQRSLFSDLGVHLVTLETSGSHRLQPSVHPPRHRQESARSTPRSPLPDHYQLIRREPLENSTPSLARGTTFGSPSRRPA